MLKLPKCVPCLIVFCFFSTIESRAQQASKLVGEELSLGEKTQLGSELFRVRSEKYYYDLSQDGKIIAFNCFDEEIHLMNAETGKRIKSWSNFDKLGARKAISFLADGSSLLIVGNEAFAIYDYKSSKMLKKIRIATESDYLESVAISNDRKTLALCIKVGKRMMLDIYDIEIFKFKKRLELKPYRFPLVRMSCDGSWIAVGESIRDTHHNQQEEDIAKDVQIWNINSGMNNTVVHHDKPVRIVQLSNDGELLIVQDSEGIKVSRWSDSKVTRNLLAENKETEWNNFEISKDKKSIYGSDWRKGLWKWDFKSGKLESHYPIQHVRNIEFKVLESGSPIAVSKGFLAVEMFDPETGNAINDIKGVRSRITGIQFDETGERLSASDDIFCFHQWLLRSDKYLGSNVNSLGSGFRPFTISPNGEWCVVREKDGVLVVYQRKEKEFVPSWKILEKDMFQSVFPVFSFSADSSLLFGAYLRERSSQRQAIAVWDVNKKIKIHSWNIEENSIIRIVVSKDRKKILALLSDSKDKNVKLVVRSWNLDSGEILSNLDLSNSSMDNVLFVGNDNFLAFGKYSKIIPIFNIKKGFKTNEIVVSDDLDVLRICSSPFADRVAIVHSLIKNKNNDYLDNVGRLFKCYIYDLNANKIIYKIDLANECTALAFSCDGKRLAVGMSDSTIKLYDVPASSK